MVSVEIKKGTGIEGLVGQSQWRVLEQESSLTADERTNVLAAFDTFKKHLASVDFRWRTFQSIYTYVKQSAVNHTLTPEEIRIADRLILGFVEEKERIDAEIYITRLIQQSYDAGHNGFTFDIYHDHIGTKLQGTEDNPIIITTRDIGHHGGDRSHHLTMHIKGDVGSNFGCNSRQCTFIIDGNLDHSSGFDGESTYVIKGDVHTGWMYSGYNILKIHRADTMEKLRKVPFVDYHKLIRVHPDGREELIEKQERKEREEPVHDFGFAP